MSGRKKFPACIFCGKRFIGGENIFGKRYCSPLCRKKQWRITNPSLYKLSIKRDNKKRQERIVSRRIPIIKSCVSCKHEFTAKVGTPYQLYCSFRCQRKNYLIINQHRINQWKREWARKNKDKIYDINQNAKDKLRFGGLKRIVMQRDEFKCTQCNREYPNFSLAVHHIDENKKNNIMNNLITVCKSCHIKIHAGMIELIK